MKLLGVEFAPLNVPLERRLQTLAATAWFLVGVFGIPAGWLITFLLLLFGSQGVRLVMLIYLIFVYLDRDVHITGGRGKWYSLPLRNCAWWRYFRDYFPVKLVKTVDLDPSRNYLFASFPHGILAAGVTSAFCTNALDCGKLFPGLDFRIISLVQQFHPPFMREYALAMSACSSDERSLNYLLSTKPTERDGPTEEPVTGRATVVIVGGAAEAFLCKPGTYHILLKRRKGFVRLALQNGTPLVPLFSFGETDLFDQVSNPEGSTLRQLQEWFKKRTGVAPVLLNGRGFFQYSFGLVPKRRPITVVVGAPIDVPKIEHPTKEQIEEYHAKFTEKLVELFETHKSKYVADHENTHLIME